MADIVVGYRGAGLWCLEEGAVCPRVGDIVVYYFDVAGDTLKNYNDDAVKWNTKMHGSEWVVVKVEHQIKETDYNRKRVSTWVMVKPLKKKK